MEIKDMSYMRIAVGILITGLTFVPFMGFVMLYMLDELFNLTHTLSYFNCLWVGLGACFLKKTIFRRRLDSDS